MDSAKSVAATFTEIIYQLTVSRSGSGTVTSDVVGIELDGISCGTNCGEHYRSGTSVGLSALAGEGYHFEEWTGSGVDAGRVADRHEASTSITMDGNYGVVANFAVDTHTLTVTSSPGGSVTGPGEGAFSYDYGTVVNLMTAAADGYRFAGWSGNGVDAGMVEDATAAVTRITVRGDCAIRADFVTDDFPWEIFLPAMMRK